MTRDALLARAFDAFRADAETPPPLTLRGGNAVDSYDRAEPYDEALDAPTDEYIERFAFWGVSYLDAQSWRHYLPRLMEYALRRPDDPAMAAEALVQSLRPPDRYPPRLASLTRDQEEVVRAFLEELALGEWPEDRREDAQQALEEWWLPDARLRPTPAEVAAARATPVEYHTVGAGRHRLRLPTTFAAGGVRHIESESRTVESWWGNLCGDVPTRVAVNWTPLGDESPSQRARRLAAGLLETTGRGEAIRVPGAARAWRLDGTPHGDSPADRERITFVLAAVGRELVALTVVTWPRDDVAAEVERIVSSFELVEGGR